MEIVAKLTCYMTLVSRDEQKLKDEKGEEERKRRQTKEQLNKKQRKKKEENGRGLGRGGGRFSLHSLPICLILT